MLKLAVVAVFVVFLASTAHGLWFRGLRDTLYTPVEDEVYNRITRNIRLLEKKFADNSKIVNNTIAADVRPAVLVLTGRRVNKAKTKINKDVALKTACSAEAQTARDNLKLVVLRKPFLGIQTCVKEALKGIIEVRKKSKERAIEAMKKEMKKMDDGECYDYIGSQFGLVNAKLCCRRITETVDRILEVGLSDMEFPDITKELDQSVNNCKEGDLEYAALLTEITGHLMAFDACVKKP